MIEFHGACLAAPAARLVSERATAAVALVDLAFDGVGDVTRRGSFRVFVRSLSPLPTRREALLLHLFDEQSRGPSRRLSPRLRPGPGGGADPAPGGTSHDTRHSR